jgi:putative sigma-54 modulation protein
MNIQIQSVHFDADKKLLSFIEEKVGKLNVMHDKIVKSEVTLKLDKSESNENKVAEIRLHVPGNDLFAKKQCATFEEATDLAVDALKTQIKRYKERAQ